MHPRLQAGTVQPAGIPTEHIIIEYFFKFNAEVMMTLQLERGYDQRKNRKVLDASIYGLC